MFSCEYCEIFKSSYFEKHLQTTASVNSSAAIFQESLALPFKRNALTFRICNLGKLAQTGRWGFYLPYSPEKFSKFWPKNTCFMFSKVFEIFVFPYLAPSWYILAQSLLKTFPKWKHVFLFLFSSCIWLFKVIETISYFSKRSILTNKGPLVLFSYEGCILLAKLIISCQSKQKTTN